MRGQRAGINHPGIRYQLHQAVKKFFVVLLTILSLLILAVFLTWAMHPAPAGAAGRQGDGRQGGLVGARQHADHPPHGRQPAAGLRLVAVEGLIEPA
jgi:hypothetical protein